MRCIFLLPSIYHYLLGHTSIIYTQKQKRAISLQTEFWLGVWQTFSHMHSTSGDSLRGLGVIRQVGEHFIIIGKLKPVHQSVVLFSFSIQGPKL